MTNQPVTMIGPYQFVEHIGHGQIGHVARAEDTRNGQTVALKFLHNELSNNTEANHGFRGHVQVMQSLAHPNVVPVLDTGDYDEIPYMVMPFLERKLTDAMPPEQVAEILQGIVAALEHAYRQKTAHHNLKPNNVLLDANGTPYVSDFAGMPATPQALAADAFALGKLVYQMLTGQPYADGAPLDGLPKAVAPVVQRALHVATDARYPDAMSFAQDFALAVESLPKRVRQQPVAQDTPRRRSPVMAVVLLILIVAVVGAGLFAWQSDLLPSSDAVAVAATSTLSESALTRRALGDTTEEAMAETVTAAPEVTASTEETEESTESATDTAEVIAAPEDTTAPTEEATETTTPTIAASDTPTEIPPTVSGTAIEQTQIAHSAATQTSLAGNDVSAAGVTQTPQSTATRAPSVTPLPSVTPTPTATPSPTETSEPVIVTARNTTVNVRQSDSTSALVIGALLPGESYEALAISPDGWLQIAYQAGEVGWVAAFVVDVQGDTSQLEEIDP